MASSDDLIVLTGASGQQCRALLAHLYNKFALRLVVNSSTSLDRLGNQYSSAEVVQADIALPQDCAKIMKGASTIYHVGPSFHPHEKEIGLNMIDAAVAESERPGSKFKHFVLSSVLNTQLRKMANHDDKRYVEEYIIESGLNFTILQPGDFLDQQFHVREWMGVEKPVLQCMVSPKSKSSLVVLKDLGEASAKVIVEREKHYQAQYPLVSFGPIEYGEVAEKVSEGMGKRIHLEKLTLEQAADLCLKYIYGSADKAPVRSRDKAERLVLFYSRRGIQGNPNVLQWLLGRKPTTIAEYTKAQVDEANAK
jgi:uncharacterized protein YbjT (DUF2867 family)